MFIYALDRRPALVLRLAGLALVVWSVFASAEPPASHGRGLVVALLLGASVVAGLRWARTARREQLISLDLYVLAVAGGALTGACSGSAASAFVFVAIVAAALREELPRVLPLGILGTVALAVSVLVYEGSDLGLLAYALGFVAAALGASNSRQSVVRADQAELLLAQSQRSHEEQLRAARLEESARIARDIHDVLAHTLAGLTIQLEATGALLEGDADRATVLERVRRAHELAREGLRETRRAVGALRGDPVSVPEALRTLLLDHRQQNEVTAELVIDGEPSRLSGARGEAVLRVVQEALTNTRKHAPGAEVTVRVEAGGPGQATTATVISRGGSAAGSAELAASGGGYGIRGMRERAEQLGGTLEAGPEPDGWRVALRLPPERGESPR